jgi:sulfate adenylyltransferase subunit 2
MSLDVLESEAIEIFREAIAGAERPVLLFSGGKDSSVLLRLARKAFHPSPPPFPLLHIDTTWKFRAMYAQRDLAAREAGLELLVHRNDAALAAGVNPFTHGSSYYTDQMKTEGLRQALDAHGFDVIFGGARRDEEASRAKERICSFRSPGHRWDPKSQRPELWSIYNMRLRPGETMRVFPLSNWTELDIWRYIETEGIAICPLYFAEERPVVSRTGTLLMVDDERFPLTPGEQPERRLVRFRTLGCYPLSGAIESRATTVAEIIAETVAAAASERQGRLIDSDQPGSMEKKKREGYF